MGKKLLPLNPLEEFDGEALYLPTFLSCTYNSFQEELTMKLISFLGISLPSVREGLSHLFFANSLTLLATATDKNCRTIRDTHNSFTFHFVQKINSPKTKVIFSGNCNQDKKN